MSTTNASTAPEFISLEEAAAMETGTRVTFIPGLPAMYSEALKNICYVKGIPLIRALHPMMGIDKETGEDRQARLYKLTSQTSLPTMLHDQERPRNVWIEQLALAERIGADGTPVLIPEDFEQRTEVLGLCAVVLGEDGLVWNMRILTDGPLARKYGYSEAASAAAPGKIAGRAPPDRPPPRSSAAARGALPRGRLRVSHRRVLGNVQHVRDRCTGGHHAPYPAEPGMLKFFASNGHIPAVAEALSPRIAEHQRYILTTYCETPAVLGGDPIERS